jgi:bacillopeptidase F
VDVVLVKDGSEYDRVLTDDSGVFEFEDISLTEGDNLISSYALNNRGGESESSKSYTIRVDRTPPDMSVTSPSDGQTYVGQTERIAEFRGEVEEEGTRVYVGERVAIVSTDGSFELQYQLQEGDQEVAVRAVDKAGNETAQTFKLRWEP